MLKATPTDLPGVIVLEYEKYFESRGCSYSNFSRRELIEAGIETDFVEENLYCPKMAGTLYGIIFKTIRWLSMTLKPPFLKIATVICN